MTSRRELRFETLDDAVRDAEHLLAVGYDKAGNWDLGQCCGHITEWMRFPMDGFPRPPFVLRGVMFLLRNTIGPGMLRKILADRSMPAGGATLKGTIPPPGDDARAVEKLRETVGRANAYTGDLKPSPLFGKMTRETWIGLNLIHTAHHLSFLVPKTAGTTPAEK